MNNNQQVGGQRPAAGGANNNNAAPAAGGGGGVMGAISTFIRFMAIYYIASYAISKFLNNGGDNNSLVNNNNGTTTVKLDNGTTIVQPSNTVRLTNLWQEGVRFDMKVYFSPSNETIGDWLVWEEKNLSYDWDNRNTIPSKNFTFKTTPYLQNNGSLFAHIISTKHAYLNQPKSSLHKVHPLNVYLPKPKPKGKHLLDEKVNDEPEEIYDPNELISYWKPTLSLHLITDFTIYPPDSIPKEIVTYFNISKKGYYTPITYCNEFWLYREHLFPINETVKDLSIEISYSPMGLFKWQFHIQMQKSLDMQDTLGGMGGSGASNMGDEFKRMLTDNDPWILVLTFIVSILHTIFEFLAFKNDIQFWKNNKSMEGLSVKTITLNCVCMGIIFLYLLDNETSYMIMASSGFGFLVELWKLGKAMTIKITWMESLPFLPKRIQFIDKAEYISKTKQYDDMAMKYLSWLLFPLVVGTSIYSLYYHEHKSWYSWVVSSLVRTVYTFEFIMMTPQLFINYKLKSVSHLPWRVFMYRALNTFIDDLFAFIIKMPLLHRLSCLRDDIIFIVYLYQRWIYPVDKKRSHYGSEEQDEIDTTATTSTATIESSSSSSSTKKEEDEKQEVQDNENDEKEEKDEDTSSSSKITKRKTKKI